MAHSPYIGHSEYVDFRSLLEVETFTSILGYLFFSENVLDKGTLYQLKVMLNRSSVPKNPKVNMKTYEDFLLVVSHALLRIAGEVVLKDQAQSVVSKS